ncbi:unnamed protein product, partial [Ectocarpus sp. 4 AP-2014]
MVALWLAVPYLPIVGAGWPHLEGAVCWPACFVTNRCMRCCEERLSYCRYVAVRMSCNCANTIPMLWPCSGDAISCDTSSPASCAWDGRKQESMIRTRFTCHAPQHF